MTLDNFWNIIELSWKNAPTIDNQRQQALKTNDEEILQELSTQIEDEIIEHYNNHLRQLSKEELTSFIHHLEERMYHIDRQDIHEYADESDDGFLYGRCFIVGMGENYYNMIDKEPSKATTEVEAELFGFSAYAIYEEKTGEEFERYTYHSMESCSNREHWKF